MEKLLKSEIKAYEKLIPEYIVYSTFSENPEDLLILIETYSRGSDVD